MNDIETQAFNRQARRTYNSVGFALIWQTLFVLASEILIFFALMAIFGEFNNFYLIYFLSVAQNIFPFIYYYFKHREKIRPFLHKRTPIRAKYVVGGSIFCLGANGAFSLLVGLIAYLLLRGGVEATEPDFALTGTIVQNIVMIFFMVIAAPITEEILYRGMIYPVLRQYGAAFAIVATSLIFSLVHGNIMQAVPTFFVGLTLAYVTEMTGSIHTAILIHMINNFIATFIGYVPSGYGNLLVLFLIPASFVILAVWLARGIKPTNNPFVPKSTRWFSFLTSPTIIITFVLYLTIILLSFRSIG